MNIQPKPPHDTTAAPLLTPWRVGNLELVNRMVMAPMTRSRADVAGVPTPLAATYYAQRASAGLIVTEATHVSPGGGYFRTPGIHTPAQVARWKDTADAVHRAGGKIFVQLWHTGRASHPDLLGGTLPVAPSAIVSEGGTRVNETERKPRVAPRALEIAEIAQLVADFRKGAENAIAAGFDGVELHGANGYLIDQFTRDGANRRTDRYGGSIENRARFGLEIADAVASAIGAHRLGYRISPTGAFNSMSDSNPVATFSYMTEQLSRRRIAYLHVVDPVTDKNRVAPLLRPKFNGTMIVCGAFDFASANAAIAAGETDLVAFGQPFLANPDLPRRYATGAPLNAAAQATFYTDGPHGYTDYPALGA